MITPRNPQQVETQAAGFAQRLTMLLAEAETLDAFADQQLTDEALSAGVLLQGYQQTTPQREGEAPGLTPVPWTKEQLAAAREMYDLPKKLVAYMRRETPTGKSPAKAAHGMAAMGAQLPTP